MDLDLENKIIDYTLSILDLTEFNRLPIKNELNEFGIEGDFSYIELNKVYKICEEQNLIDKKKRRYDATLTLNGHNIKRSGGWLKHLENEKIKIEKKESRDVLELEIRNKEKEIRVLTISNLKLQNKHLSRYIFYSIISFVLGVVISNLKEISNLIEILKQ